MFCQMALEYRLASQRDLAVLNNYGSGRLEIDVLTARCLINGHEVRPLKFAVELQEWHRHQLTSKHIRPEDVLQAAIEISFSIDLRDEGHPLTFSAYCQFASRSTIRTDEMTYKGQSEGRRVWGYLRDPTTHLGSSWSS